jgi:hypothetical protein
MEKLDYYVCCIDECKDAETMLLFINSAYNDLDKLDLMCLVAYAFHSAEIIYELSIRKEF